VNRPFVAVSKNGELGQAGNPLHADEAFMKGLGFTDRELDVMTKEVPARLLGL